MIHARRLGVRFGILLAGFGVLLLSACSRGGGGGGGGSAPPAVGNVVANAGQDVDAAAGALARLDASFSYDKSALDGGLTYSWVQTGGASVVLSDPSSPFPTFTSPAATGDLTFQVSVSNGTDTAQDTIVVHNKRFVARAGRVRTSQATSTGGTCVAGTKNFTITGGTNFNAAGVAPGDTLLLLDGADAGAYRVNKVASNTSLSVQSPVPLAGSSPNPWTILCEDPYFWGYGVAGSIQSMVIGSPVGTLSYAWSGVQPWMPVTGASSGTIAFTTPALPQLMQLPEEPGVLAVRAPAMGRLQFQVTVTDDNGTPGDPSDDVADEEYLNFSAGQMTTGLENAPLGEPVFLSGGTLRKQETSASFVLVGGTAAVYEIVEAARVRAMRENQTPLLEMASLSGVDGTPGSWWWNAGILYVHATDSSAVPTNARGYHAYVADSWTWTVTDPTGASVALFRPSRAALGTATDERTPYFVPTRTGVYSVILSRIYGLLEDNKAFVVNIGQFVGVGTIVGIAPDPAEGECGSCHGGAVPWLANIRESWSQTGHARWLEDAFTPGTPEWGAYQAKDDWRDITAMQTRTTGMAFVNALDLSQSLGTAVLPTSTASAHLPTGGFDDQALYRNWSHVGMTWDDLKAREPSIAAMGNVQCESCHGPGSLHAGNTEGIRKSTDEGVCGRCHSNVPPMWDGSAHAKIVVSPSGSGSCVGCHEASASVTALKQAAGLPEPRQVLWANAAAPLPVVPEHVRRGETCAVCHNPHARTEGAAPGEGHEQLRLVGQVSFMNGAVADAGKAAVCYMCHQSRTNTTDWTPVTGHMALRRAPHAGNTAAEMISKANGMEYAGWTYQSSPHAIQSAFVVGGTTENEHCITCHMKVTPSEGQFGYRAIGGHTWWMEQGGAGHPAVAAEIADQSTHPGGAVAAGTKSFSVTGGPSFLGRVYAGDRLFLEDGSDAGDYAITSVDNGRMVTVSAAADFTGTTQPTLWHVDSIPKFNTLACNQCHIVGPGFEVQARGDYDGDGTLETVQEETEGMLEAVHAAVEAAINDPALPKGLGGGPYTLTEASGRVAYRNAAGTTRAFPGPSGASPQQTDWDALTPDQQTEWVRLYKAAYNFFFVEVDRSEGIHNTGYTVGLLQAAYLDLTGLVLGAPFVPIPGYGD